MRAALPLAGLLLACGSGGAGAVCAPACAAGRACCGALCVNISNDPKNCGACGALCGGATPLCEAGACQAAPCGLDAGSCAGGALCCGLECCAAGQLCCSSEGPVSGGPPSCFTPTQSASTCPQGCAPECRSDRAAKQGPATVDERQVLERLATLPISTWSYTTDPSATRHLGPMAQDFHAAFQLGSDDRSYHPVDVHGVSLAALKALRGLLLEQQRRIDALERQNQALRQRVCR